MSNLLKSIADIAVSPLKPSTIRTAAYTAGGALIGGPVGAAAGFAVGTAQTQGDKATAQAKGASDRAFSYQQERNGLLDKQQADLAQSLAGNQGKNNSLIARAARSRRGSGIFGGAVETTPAGPSATLG